MGRSGRRLHTRRLPSIPLFFTGKVARPHSARTPHLTPPPPLGPRSPAQPASPSCAAHKRFIRALHWFGPCVWRLQTIWAGVLGVRTTWAAGVVALGQQQPFVVPVLAPHLCGRAPLPCPLPCPVRSLCHENSTVCCLRRGALGWRGQQRRQPRGVEGRWVGQLCVWGGPCPSPPPPSTARPPPRARGRPVFD